MKSWEKDGLIEIHRVNSLLFTKPRRVDLILKLAVFKPDKRVELSDGVSNGSHGSNVKLPVRLHEVRRFAIESLLLKKIEFSVDDWRFLDLLFKSYLDDVENKVIVLKNVVDESYLLLPYKHRFKYIKKYIKKYDDLWNFFSRYSVGVFMTFTVDPSRYRNLWEVSREVPKAFNRFKSWLKKRLGFNPPHICVYEFQDNGRLHLHVILFGVSRIGDKFTEITPELVRIGFGKINYLYKIVNRGKWVWAGEKPGGGGPREYLKKYLVKSFKLFFGDSNDSSVGVVNVDVMKLSMYWASGKRFFSYSRIEGVKVKVKVVRGLYEFVGVFDVLDLPDYVLEYYVLEFVVGPPVYT
ncbi:MAG: hypothetical protein QXQ91_03970 [Nanopusillaceae archaeon]